MKLEPIDPLEAALELCQPMTWVSPRTDRVDAAESTAAKNELGLGLASFVIGTLVVLSIIPVAMSSGWASLALTIPLGALAFALGCIGRPSAFGTAGMALSAVAVIEGIVFLGWRSHDTKQQMVLAAVNLENTRAAVELEQEKLRVEKLAGETTSLRLEAARLEAQKTDELAGIEGSKARRAADLLQAKERLAHTLSALAQTRSALQAQNPAAVADIPTNDEIEQLSDILELMRRENERAISLHAAENELREKAGRKPVAPREPDKAAEIKTKSLTLWQLKLANATKERGIALQGKPVYRRQSLQSPGGVSVTQDNSEEIARWEAHLARIESEISSCRQMIKTLTK